MDDLDSRTICLSVDVEWASAPVLDDLLRLLCERNLTATFFVTHDGVEVPGHERGIHPNFRSEGDVRRNWHRPKADFASSDAVMYEHVVSTVKGFAPEAVGVRGHSLHYDSLLLKAYHDHGIEYDSTYQIPLVPNLTPFWKEQRIVEIPIFFNDFFELKTGTLGFDGGLLDLDAPGVKVFDIHPNTMYINASSLSHYETTRAFYADPERLLAERHHGAGIRTMVVDILDRIASRGYRTMTLGELNALWRSLP